VDRDPAAVGFSRDCFVRPNLAYQCMSVEDLSPLPGDLFDVVFSSNVLEHVNCVADVLRGVCRVLRSDGMLIAAVPATLGDPSVVDNLRNGYHTVIWSARQWHSALSAYFKDLQVYEHEFTRRDVALDLSNRQEDTVIDERDFAFHPVPSELWGTGPTISFTVVARNPRPMEELPDAIPFVDASFTRDTHDRAVQIISSLVVKYWDLTQSLTALAEERRRDLDTMAQAKEQVEAEVAELRVRLEHEQTRHDELHAQLIDWNTHWTDLERTLAWRLLMRGRRIRKAIAPPGTMRERMWHRMSGASRLSVRDEHLVEERGQG
jgi:SAM-dependent methyltransferase